MKKIQELLRKWCVIMLVATIAIVLLEAESFGELRREGVLIFSWLDGKRALFSNIFIGIFASAFCMWIGEAVNLKYIKKDLEREIRQIFDEIWPQLCLVSGTRNYIENSHIIMQYQDKIKTLCVNYNIKRSDEYYVIGYLDTLLKYYNIIHEKEYMKNSYIYSFQEYITELEKLVDGDLKKLYFESLNDEKAMEIKRTFENMVNWQTKYNAEYDEEINSYVNKIKEIEPKLKELYFKQVNYYGNTN